MHRTCAFFVLLLACGETKRDGVITGNPDVPPDPYIELLYIGYSALVPLDASAQDVFVFGLPRALAPKDGTLTVGAAEAPSTDVGSFVGVVSAKLDDTLTLTYRIEEKEDTAELTLEEPLAELAPLEDPEGLFSPPDNEGWIDIDASQLSAESGHVAFNVTSGATASAFAGASQLRVGAAHGDRVCVARWSAPTRLASTAYCALVP